jgi:hypothetical protein
MIKASVTYMIIFHVKKKREILIDRHYNFFFFLRSRYIKRANQKIVKNKKYEKKIKIKNYKNKK